MVNIYYYANRFNVLLFSITFFDYYITGVEINCYFVTDWIYRGERYSCSATLDDVLEPKVFISSVRGNHNENRSNDDIQAVGIQDQTTRFLLKGMTNFFPNMDQLYVLRSDLTNLSRSDFDGQSKLTTLSLSRNHLSSIPYDTFEDLIELEYLLLFLNQLTSVPNLKTLKNLEQIYLNDNSIWSLSAADFSSNPKLQIIWLQHNKLKIIDSDVFESLPSLVSADLRRNKCIDMSCNETSSQLFFNAVKSNCRSHAVIDVDFNDRNEEANSIEN